MRFYSQFITYFCYSLFHGTEASIQILLVLGFTHIQRCDRQAKSWKCIYVYHLRAYTQWRWPWWRWCEWRKGAEREDWGRWENDQNDDEYGGGGNNKNINIDKLPALFCYIIVFLDSSDRYLIFGCCIESRRISICTLTITSYQCTVKTYTWRAVKYLQMQCHNLWSRISKQSGRHQILRFLEVMRVCRHV